MLMLTFSRAFGFAFPRIQSSRVVVHSDGNAFRIQAADAPVVFPTPPGSTVQIASLGFWYTRNGATECTVVMIRPYKAADVFQHIDVITDKLTDRLSRGYRLASAYEFNCHEMVLKVC